MSKQELFDAATIVFLHAIAMQLPFESALEDGTVQDAIRAGYNVEVIKWAWM